MLYFLQGLVALVLSACGVASNKSRPQTNNPMENKSATSFYDLKLKSLDEKEEISFEKYKGKKVLLVNVASKCGLTPQYKGLQELHEKHGDKLVILGFPANNFMGQEPASNSEIGEFCQKNYGVSFQMFSKVSVKGADQHAVYQWLTKKDMNGWNDQIPDWNFAKYLVNENGELAKFFNARTEPMSTEILEAIK